MMKSEDKSILRAEQRKETMKYKVNYFPEHNAEINIPM